MTPRILCGVMLHMLLCWAQYSLKLRLTLRAIVLRQSWQRLLHVCALCFRIARIMDCIRPPMLYNPECKALCKAPDLSAARNASLALATIPQGSAGPAVSTRLSTCDREKRRKDIMAKYPSHIITGATLPSMGFCKRFTFRALASIGNGFRGSAS